ncbi:MAG: hypothetical protein Q8M76_03040, partial [Spirochaetaceae bacterium]|nr:hypothetical protein [Spirochaetaceae bacterium]
MSKGRRFFSVPLLALLCSSVAWSQDSTEPDLTARLRTILQQYESNIVDLKSRIAELERELTSSEERSTTLLEDLRGSRSELSSLTSRFDLLRTQLDEYQTLLEASKRQTEISLGSLTSSIAALRTQSALQTSALV